MKSKYNYPIDLQPNKSYKVKVSFLVEFLSIKQRIIEKLRIKSI